MKINYNDFNFEVEQKNPEEISKLNFLHTNSFGDFINFGIEKNSTKYQGYNFVNQKNLDVFKIIDEIVLENNLELENIKYFGNSTKRYFRNKTQDEFYLTENRCFVYEINNYNGNISIDLDIKKQNDFNKWGRSYKTTIDKKNNIIFVEYNKNGSDNYKIFFGIKIPKNIHYHILENWIEKNYEYSARRNSLSNWHSYKFLQIFCDKNLKLIMSTGITKSEIITNLSKKTQKTKIKIKIQENNLKKSCPTNIKNSYELTKLAITNFQNKNGTFAGFPWFSQIWARDELVGLGGILNLGQEKYVKEKLFYYLEKIDKKTGCIKRINIKGSLPSPDATFWLAKRFENINLTKSETKNIYDIFYNSYKKIIQKFLNENGLIKVKYGDSWMDTIDVNFPLDIQCQFLSLINFLIKIKSTPELENFKKEFEKNIKLNFYENGFLYNEPKSIKKTVNSNIFLAYYFAKDLFSKKNWEEIFDNSLSELLTSWGGISSLSYKNSEFQKNYTGENNLSYHRGDSWYWINNLAANCMFELNKTKYKKIIENIINSSTRDILELGTIGYSSEISEAENQKSFGCFAQLWSSTTYLELIEKYYKR